MVLSLLLSPASRIIQEVLVPHVYSISSLSCIIRLWAQVFATSYHNLYCVIMAGNLASSSLRDTQHIPKLNGDNHHEWSYEVLSIAEQHSLKDLLIAPDGGVLSTRPEPVSRNNPPDQTNLI